MANVQLLGHTPEPEKIIACAAKLCYSDVGIMELKDGLTQEKAEQFLKRLMSMGHESPIEHVNFTFAIEGISRVCSHQLVRHRIASYSQQSQRYVRQDNFDYITPPAIKENSKALSIFEDAMNGAMIAYQELVVELMNSQASKWIFENTGRVCNENAYEELLKLDETKVARGVEKKAIEDARFAFPNAAGTKIVVTMNARTILNFLHHRGCRRAQWEINDVAWQMLDILKEIAPTLFSVAGPHCLHGKCTEGPMSCGQPYTI